MEALKRARRPVRRKFENTIRELDKLLKQDPLNIDDISVKFESFNEVFESLQSHDAKIVEQMTTDGVTEAEEDKEWDEIGELNERGKSIRLLKEKMVDSKIEDKTTESIVGSATDTRFRNFKLPAMQMKKFSGEMKDWLGFWAQFQKIHEDPHMSGSDKYGYLLQSLEPGSDAHEIVTHYPASNENYDMVIEALKKHYGNEDFLLQVYIRDILSLVIFNVNSKGKLPTKTLFLKLDSHLRALKTLNLQKADPATWLFPLVESCLPEKMLEGWEHDPLSSHDGSQDTPPRTRLDLLMSFVEREVQIRRRVDLTRTFAIQQKVETTERKLLPKERKFEEKKRSNVPTLSSFHNTERRCCLFCNLTNHEAANCFRAKSMNYEEKMKILKEKGLCFWCMGTHLANQCREQLQCGNCQRRHATVLCKENVTKERKRHSGARYGGFIQPNNNKRKFFSPTPIETSASTFKRPAIGGEPQQPSNVTSSNANVECSSEIALQTLLVKVTYGRESKVVRAFIDSGSQRSYLLKSTVKALSMRPFGVEKVVHSLFGGKQTSTVTHNKYELQLSSLQSNFVKSFVIRDSEKICGKLPTIPSKYPEIVTELLSKNVILTDCDADKKDVELLIGADIYATIVTGKIEKLRRGAAAVHTDLGWTLLGNVTDHERDDIASLCLSMSVQDANIAKLWELDVIGVEDPSKEKSEKKRLELEIEKFVENISRDDDGRYIVKLPWKNNLSLLPSNRPVAFKRLETASKKLIEKKLFAAYHTIFADWEKEGFIERVSLESDSDVIHYLPHRPIIKESMTTPVRPVFDASCHVGKAPSLNDCLFTGENKVKAIPELILRFREKRIAFVSDIRKAFQMIGVKVEDRDAMRFLWWTDEAMKKLVEYRHVRVMFGATCSPFILEAVLHFHLTNLPEDKRDIGEKLMSALYVDNCVSSEHSVESYQLFREQATELLKNAKMDLRMWFSNVDEFDDPATHSVSVLGLQWDRINDELFVSVKKVTVPVKVSKRAVLSAVQKIFDPIGFTSPALLPMKLLLQRAWIHKLKWDDDLPEIERRAFVKWCDEVSELEAIRLPRLSTAGVSDKSNWSLHIFTDASKDAYAAVVFLRVQRESSVSVQLLSAKSRVAPIKPLTIPKLELMGCLIGKRLIEMVRKALNLEGVKEYFWSDSTTAIAWIRQDPELWGTFVSNRTKEIRDGAAADKWRHVPGHNNPADLPSRGCFPSKLALSKWWIGPTWLYEDEERWPESSEEINENDIFSERR